MTCSQDQTYRDVLYGASDAALELRESKLCCFVYGNQGVLRDTCTDEFKVQFLTYSIRAAGRLDLGKHSTSTVKPAECEEEAHKISMGIILACLDSLQRRNSLP